jgi:hypothetical protein
MSIMHVAAPSRGGGIRLEELHDLLRDVSDIIAHAHQSIGAATTDRYAGTAHIGFDKPGHPRRSAATRARTPIARVYSGRPQ